ncbi:recombinase family protein [Cytophaga hutchinsonii]|uniref:DNA resolvase n=1 Tax=Cytophaga hutchinsonii (strain ATCC 33406 / DSM 1761 / CIP 103989 / NBRC 15051 / NCIMB 9469 / D465) TaxID=269798 RepID=A0A6N4SUN5_CYTH3|nr:recombinase family protein [Cytophaga hutchinsonii]ABG60202.1 DNA resolvase [Cytophaga hutchinsonii ATCC 33406]SFX22048.1 Site-specific DNA recombinase [Cytophaga hutchinsonii ATCC 33406]
MNRLVILARVSTSKQDTERQLSDLNEVCTRNQYDLVNTFTETVSGKYGITERTTLQAIIKMAELKQFDKLLVSEVSRIGRKTSEVLKFIEILTERKISIYIHNYGLETLDRNLNQNPLIGMMINFLSSFSDMERTLTISRVKSGLEEARRRNVILGRPKNSTKDIDIFIDENKRLFELIKKQLTIREIARLTYKSTTTVVKAIKLYKLHPEKFLSAT